MNTNLQMDGGTNPNLPPHGVDPFGSQHSDGQIANFTFADGSVHSLSKDINPIVYQRLSTRAGQELIDESQVY
jgi:prepilin-type processing-associated H-X9-DG protein